MSCTFSGRSQVNVGADMGSCVSAKDCRFQGTTLANMQFQAGSTGVLTRCATKGSGGRGVHVTGAGARLTADCCSFEDSKIANVAVHDSAAATFKDCRATGSEKGAGLLVVGRGTSVQATGFSFESCHQTGVYVKDGADCSLKRCAMQGCSTGMFIAGEGSRLVAEGCSMQGSSGNHLQVDQNACASLIDCTLEGSLKGSGVLARSGARVEATRCTALGNALHGVQVMDRASARLEQCVLTALDGSSGVCLAALHPGSSAEAVGCTFTRLPGVTAVGAGQGAHVTLEGCRVQGGGPDDHCAESLGPGSRLHIRGGTLLDGPTASLGQGVVVVDEEGGEAA